MTYTVLRKCAGREPGDTIEAGELSEVDAAYLLQIGAIEAEQSLTPPPKRGRKVSSESED